MHRKYVKLKIYKMFKYSLKQLMKQWNETALIIRLFSNYNLLCNEFLQFYELCIKCINCKVRNEAIRNKIITNFKFSFINRNIISDKTFDETFDC